MKLRKLGRNGPQVSAIGLGCMGFSEFYACDAATDADAIGVIRNAITLGLTFLDTADMYGPHANEVLVGKAIAGKRDQVFLATKFGVQRDPANPRLRGISGKPDYVRSACEASLRRLNVERIDLYYQHRVDPSTPIEDTVGAMAELVKAGKVASIGLSEPSAATIARAHKIHPITAVQSEYSLWSRDPEDGVLQACSELGIGFVPYSPLGRGFLTGRYRSIDDLDAKDFRRHSPRFQGENFAKNLSLVDKVQEIAKEKNCTPAQLALAWLLAQAPNIVPIPGTTNVTRLKENIASADVALNAADLARIAAVAPSGIAAGERYDESGMRFVNG
ncbi:MAG TPA: aldo/keto reductase [Steroidobacteraceae bacterium]|jgi:aryl-alcohol dehydrogenase-like predicted oxidoreductase